MNPDIKAPLKEALELLTGQPIPEEQFGDMTGIYHSNQLPEKLAIALEDWCALHARPSWAGGSGTLEAAEVLVSHAVDAGNIPIPEEDLPNIEALPTTELQGLPTIPAFPDDRAPNPFTRLVTEGFGTFRMSEPLTVSLDPNPTWIDVVKDLPRPMTLVDLRVGDRIILKVYLRHCWMRLKDGKEEQIQLTGQTFWREAQ